MYCTMLVMSYKLIIAMIVSERGWRRNCWVGSVEQGELAGRVMVVSKSVFVGVSIGMAGMINLRGTLENRL
jgi:hypothetical protein